MDQEQSKAGQELADEEDRTPEQVRDEIAQTRADLGYRHRAVREGGCQERGQAGGQRCQGDRGRQTHRRQAN